MTAIEIGSPSGDDWSWITEHHVETAWDSLTSNLQQMVSKQVVQECVTDQMTKIREKHGVTNQVFLAHDGEGQRVGFIWVDQVRSAFTGTLHAYILEIFVADEYRGQGIGSLLMAQAETWAREHQLARIGLSVATHNAVAIELYEKLGYETETLRMFKNLAS